VSRKKFHAQAVSGLILKLTPGAVVLSWRGDKGVELGKEEEW